MSVSVKKCQKSIRDYFEHSFQPFWCISGYHIGGDGEIAKLTTASYDVILPSWRRMKPSSLTVNMAKEQAIVSGSWTPEMKSIAN